MKVYLSLCAVIVCLVQCDVRRHFKVENLDFYTTIFGDGKFPDSDEDFITKHKSSSTEDLMILFQKEVALVKTISTLMPLIRENYALLDVVKKYLQQIDYNIDEENSDYVFHPINAFHLLERTTYILKWIPKLKMISTEIDFNFDLESLKEDFDRAHHGLADLQEYVDLNPDDIANGIIKDPNDEQIYASKSGLTSMNLLNVASEANAVNYLEGFIQWLTSALHKVETEELSDSDLKFNYINDLKRNIQTAKDIHDDIYMKIVDNEYSGYIFRNWPSLRELPFTDNLKDVGRVLDRLMMTRYFNDTYTNLLPEGKVWDQTNLMGRMKFYYRRKTQSACQNKLQIPANNTKDLKCFNLHHGNPYLQLGPFKYEMILKEPEIGLFHQLITPQEAENMKHLARSKMISTPYNVGGKNELFSKLRTSKIMYMNENLVKEAMAVSRKIHWATRMNLANERFASENFQVMNYGIGGKISIHLDSTGEVIENGTSSNDGTSEWSKIGGQRFVTFMVYLSSVEAGGATAFPQPGMSIKPEIGSALYWFNMGAQNNFDSRILHLGCPVLYGNKWIANKWIKYLANFKNYPCLIDNNHYSIYESTQSQKH